MGKKTLAKLQEREEKEEKVKNFFSYAAQLEKSKREKELQNNAIPLKTYVPEEFYNKRCREPEDFKAKFKTDDVEKRFLYFTKHLFCKYKTPKFLDKSIETKKMNKKHFEWFVALGTGESLYKNHFKDFLTKKETHIFSNCPFDDFSVNEVLVYSIAYSESNNVGISKRIAKSKLKEKDLKNEYWRNCIRFFANEERIPENVQSVNDLVDYLQAEILRNRDFNIFGNGFTLASLKKRMIDWHHELRRAKEFGNFTWKGSDAKDYLMVRNEFKENQEIIEISQILNSKDLLAEGKEQHHCVFGYKQSCINGSCAIFSLKINGKRRVTIELRGKMVVQARGFANRLTRGEEDFIIGKWMLENGLYGRY